MRKILAGVETEYGLHVSGRGAADQVDDATSLVRCYPGSHLAKWDYRYESPRADLRGFKLESLSFDPEDAKYDAGKSRGPAHEIRSDRVLPNGARFYNDHGHPEYSTPECWSTSELALHDRAGQDVVRAAGKAFEEREGVKVSLYKNNTDYHGASYGTHEGYLIPRSVPFDRLHQAVLPMLIARQILTGAGKVGSENGRNAKYQISQRADFFAETTNTETLFRRPIFNTRDEPHSDPSKWVRLHVISGDANMIPGATARKVGLVKLALALAEIDEAPRWMIKDPVSAFQSISRDGTYEFPVELNGRSWTTAVEILESYYSAAEQLLELDQEQTTLIKDARLLARELPIQSDLVRKEVDWAAKKFLLEQVLESESLSWDDPTLVSYDLEYHNVDPEESLFTALQAMGEVGKDPDPAALEECKTRNREGTRARARGTAVARFPENIETLSWSSIVFKADQELLELTLPPDMFYPPELESCENVGTFIEMIRSAA